ncbi:hypothetical protein KAM622c_44200 [Klebsiella quasipneumoniae subsp. quasipneumoniae]|nr:hypothetical protein KAM622c_44200 [Klebsiella quasipneumoniae subsp. quasipneumoniae]
MDQPAAVCIYPRFIPIARKTLNEQGTPEIRIATVTNFPHGNDDIDIALAETRAALELSHPHWVRSFDYA